MRKTPLRMGVLTIGMALAIGPAWPQAMVEYGLLVGKSGVAGASAGAHAKAMQKALDKTRASLQKAAQAKGISTTRDVEALRNREVLAMNAGPTAATLTVKAPDGAVVSVNNHLVGWGTTSVQLPAGKHQVKVAGPAYLPWEEEVELKQEESRELAPQLERPQSTSNVIQIGRSRNP